MWFKNCFSFLLWLNANIKLHQKQKKYQTFKIILTILKLRKMNLTNSNNNTSGAVKKSKLPLLQSVIWCRPPPLEMQSWIVSMRNLLRENKIFIRNKILKYTFQQFIYLFGICNICSIIWLMTTFSLLTWNTIYSHTQDTESYNKKHTCVSPSLRIGVHYNATLSWRYLLQWYIMFVWRSA